MKKYRKCPALNFETQVEVQVHHFRTAHSSGGELWVVKDGLGLVQYQFMFYKFKSILFDQSWALAFLCEMTFNPLVMRVTKNKYPQ